MLASTTGAGQSQSGALSPLVSSYQDRFDFNRPYGQPLPRSIAEFLAGAFGPMNPVPAVGIDQPREDTGRPDPRRFQYPVGWNLPVGQPGTEGIKLAPFGTLRSLADMYSVARSCVDRRVGEIIGLGFDIVPTDEAERAMRGDDAKRADWEKRRAEVKRFFSHPDSDRAKYPTFSTWLSALLEDCFVLDAIALHLRPPRVRGKGPFNSNLASLDLLDGSTIRPLLDLSGSTPSAPNVAYQQYIWGVPRVDMAQVMLGTDIDGLTDGIVQEFRADQLMYLRYRPRNWTPYGFGPIEEALLPINIGLARQQYQWDFYQDGSIPGQFVVPGPDIATPQQIRQLQDALNAMAGDIGAKHRIIVLPPGSKADPQKPPPLADQFDEWIISQVAMPFGLTPMDLGVTPRVAAIQSPAETKQISQTNSTQGAAFRVEPITQWLKEVLFDYVIQGVFGQLDMEWSWGTAEQGEDAAEEINVHLQQVQNALESVDEARVELGKTPWGLPETSVPLVFTPQGPVPLTAAVAQAQAASDQAQAMATMAEQGKVPATPPGQPAGRTQGERGTDEHGEPTTPAHEAAEATAPHARNAGSPKSELQAESDKVKAEKAMRAELQILSRYLRKGRPIEAFRCEVLPPAALAAAVPALEKGLVSDAVAAVGDAARTWWAQQRRDHVLAALADWVAREIGQLVRSWREGRISNPAAVDQAVDVMRNGYHDAMVAASRHANDDHGAPVLDMQQAAAQRAEGQRGYVQRLMVAGQTTSDVGSLDNRFSTYGRTLTGAYNAAYGQTVQQHDGHDYEIIWRLGETEHCGLCLARAGRSFTFEDLPGWPGDGDFGGPLCEGGPNCGCHLEYVEKDQPVSVGTNTQRPDSVAYYANQNALISQTRQQARYRRERFLETIPGDAAARAADRDSVRQQLAEIANQTIRAAGGYPGVTIEPEDIPADMVAQALAAGATPDLVKLIRSAIGQKVFDYLADVYPVDTLQWVNEAQWRYDPAVPLASIDMARRPGGRDPAKVRGIAQAVKDGKPMDPVVLVDTGNPDGLQIADGYHRTLGFQHAEKSTIAAYVASGVGEHGPWDREMHDRKLNKIEAALFAAVRPIMLDALAKGWDPARHPRGPGGKFISVPHTEEFHHEPHPRVRSGEIGGKLPHEQHTGAKLPRHPKHPEVPPIRDLTPKESEALDHLLGAHTDGEISDALGDKNFHATAKALADHMRRSQLYTDEQVQRTMKHLAHLRAEVKAERDHEKKIELFVGLASVVAAILLSLFAGPLFASAPVAIGLIGEKLPELFKEVGGYTFPRLHKPVKPAHWTPPHHKHPNG